MMWWGIRDAITHEEPFPKGALWPPLDLDAAANADSRSGSPGASPCVQATVAFPPSQRACISPRARIPFVRPWLLLVVRGRIQVKDSYQPHPLIKRSNVGQIERGVMRCARASEGMADPVRACFRDLRERKGLICGAATCSTATLLPPARRRHLASPGRGACLGHSRCPVRADTRRRVIPSLQRHPLR